LFNCLQALRVLDYPRDRFEVIVVDDGGDTSLHPTVAPFRSELTMSLVEQSNAGPAAARNAGAERARGEFLAFTDDDCLPEPSWLKELAGALAAAPECMIGGATVNAVTGNLCSVASQLITEVVYRHYNADATRARFLAANNLALAACRFREIGGFDPAFRTAEDRDLCDRWLHRGNRIIYLPRARVRHARVLSPRSFCRQHFEYGRGAARFHRLRALRGSGSILADSRFHLQVGNWLWSPLKAVPRKQVIPMAVLLAAWQTANLSGFLWESARQTAGILRDGTPAFSR
jgi:GT2 family glycosyltransferase